jgi:hypothetical protein
MFEERIEKIE